MINFIRKVRNLIFSVYYFSYDLCRWLLYSGAVFCNENKRVNADVIRIYHALEKAISFSDRNYNSGWGTAELLLSKVIRYESLLDVGVREAAMGALSNYVNEFLQNETGAKRKLLAEKIKSYCSSVSDVESVINVQSNSVRVGTLDELMLSRYSVRNFSDRIVGQGVLKSAIKVAVKTPSSCNRQPWKVININKKSTIEQVLNLQNGNRGFGHLVSNLFVIVVDERVFADPVERRQGLIDGGMFSSSLSLALHARGVVSCCLNWSRPPKKDIELRRLLNIEKSHSIIMLMAYGYPVEEYTVCASRRMNEIHFIEEW
mgnify:CR=1 FL=1